MIKKIKSPIVMLIALLFNKMYLIKTDGMPN